MKTTIDRNEVSTSFSASDKADLRQLLRKLAPVTHVEKLGRYRRLRSDDLWPLLVSQICVMGSARGMERMPEGSEERARFDKDTSLSTWRTEKFSPRYMANTLKGHGATRFHAVAAQKLKDLVDTPTVVQGAEVVLLHELPGRRSRDAIREEIIKRCPDFKLKSASDFMITVGLSHDVIALDTRVIGFLTRFLDYNLPAARVQSSERIYLSVENALRDVCDASGQALAVLDRAIFRYSTMSALEYVMGPRT